MGPLRDGARALCPEKAGRKRRAGSLFAANPSKKTAGPRRPLAGGFVRRGSGDVLFECAADLGAGFASLCAEQKRAVTLVLSSVRRVTLVTATAGCGKSFLVQVLVPLWLKAHPSRTVVLSAWTAAAAVNLQRIVAHEEDDRRVHAQTVKGLTCPGSIEAPLRGHRSRLVVVDEVFQVPADELEALAKKYAGCTFLYLGDPDQMSAGMIEGDGRCRPPYWPGTPFRNMVEEDCKAPEPVHANYVRLVRQMRLDSGSADLAGVIAAISRCEDGAWAAFCDLAEGVAARSATRKRTGARSESAKVEAIAANNAGIRRQAAGGGDGPVAPTIARLIMPLRGKPTQLVAVDLLLGARARIDSNQTRTDQKKVFGDRVYDVHNYEEVTVVAVPPFPTPPGLAADAPFVGDPGIPVAPGAQVRVVVVTPDTYVEVQTDTGRLVEVKAIACPGAQRGRATLALMPYPDDCLCDVAIKFQGSTLERGLTIGSGRLNREVALMLFTRCKDFYSLYFYPPPQPGELRRALLYPSVRDKHRTAFKRLLLGLEARGSGAV